MSNDLTTERLSLVAQTPDDTRAFLAALGPEVRKALSSEWLRLVERGVGERWVHGYVAVLRADGATIGRCGFKGPPGDDGAVEIAYGVDPAREGQGYATEMAQALVRHAFGTGEVRIVRAHTLAEANASARVLTKCGFRNIGEVVDSEDGLVWRWERRNPMAKASRSLAGAARLAGVGFAGLSLGLARYPESNWLGGWGLLFAGTFWLGFLFVLCTLGFPEHCSDRVRSFLEAKDGWAVCIALAAVGFGAGVLSLPALSGKFELMNMFMGGVAGSAMTFVVWSSIRFAQAEP